MAKKSKETPLAHNPILITFIIGFIAGVLVFAAAEHFSGTSITGGVITEICGDNVCEGAEDQYTCPEDCGMPPQDPCLTDVCSDPSCDGWTCDCDNSCQPEGPVCGDGVCDEGEDCSEDCDVAMGDEPMTGGGVPA